MIPIDDVAVCTTGTCLNVGDDDGAAVVLSFTDIDCAVAVFSCVAPLFAALLRRSAVKLPQFTLRTSVLVMELYKLAVVTPLFAGVD